MVSYLLVFGFTIRSMIHLELMLIHGVRYRLKLVFLPSYGLVQQHL